MQDARPASGLTERDARHLIEHTPDYLRAKDRSQCPQIELLWVDKTTAAFQLRSYCPKGATGLIGNYFVHLKSGKISRDIEGEETITSDQLTRLTRKLLGKTHRQ
jgi:hypothetical protein